MSDPTLTDLLNGLDQYLRLDKMPDLAVLLFGILFGMLARNLVALVKGIMGFAGSFFGRMFVGWWQQVRRETPNVMDVALVVPLKIGDRRLLMMDSLIGPRRLTDVFLNTRTAFSVRIQAFFTRLERPWIYFPMPTESFFGLGLRNWRNRRRVGRGLPPMTLESARRIKYRRVYQPIETLLGQFLTNEWATQATLGEDIYLFRFVIALVYEKFSDDYIDRQFHGIVVWDQVLDHFGDDHHVAVQPELRGRVGTLRHLAEAYRAAGDDASWMFGSLFVAVPRAELRGTYEVTEVLASNGERIPVHRLTTGTLLAEDSRIIGRHRAAAAAPAPVAPSTG